MPDDSPPPLPSSPPPLRPATPPPLASPPVPAGKKGLSVGCIILLVLSPILAITFIAILAGITVPIYNRMSGNTQKFQTQVVIRDLQLGLAQYHAEYARMPPTQADGTATSEDEFLQALLGDSTHNPRKIAFIDPPKARAGAPGLAGEPGYYSLVDGWGNKFSIIVDIDGDARIPDPENPG